MHDRGNIIDVISGSQIPFSPEEKNTQLLAKWLLSLGYRKEQLQTHPQYAIKYNKKTFWVDIGIFEDEDRSKPPVAIAECKKSGKKTSEGIEQLHNYLRKSGAKFGIWFDGENLSYIINMENAVHHMNVEMLQNLPEIECGAFIRSKREELLKTDNSFSIRGFAKQLEVQPTYISKIERGTVPASDDMMIKIANTLKIKEEELFMRAGRIHPNIREIITARPEFFQKLMRMLKDMSDDQIKEITRKVRDGDW